jgi:hypothetical protein
MRLRIPFTSLLLVLFLPMLLLPLMFFRRSLWLSKEKAMRDPVRCAHCGCTIEWNPRIKNQRYCSNKVCQRARKTLWQKQKLAADPDYKQNQQDSQKLWCSKNRHYWSDYRRRNECYAERNRTLQKTRDSRRKRLKTNLDLAKMDASEAVFSVKQGTYYLVPEASPWPGLAKMDALVQKVCLIPVS